MITIYDKEGVTVTHHEDDDVSIALEGKRVITITAQEFDAICQAWLDMVEGDRHQ